jgi:hypothetical protein
MVHLIGWERGASGLRATNDGDAVLDVRASGDMLFTFTAALSQIGFSSAGESMEGHQHRWERGNAQIDVLIPTGIGERAATKKGITGGTTIQAPGAQRALDSAVATEVRLGGETGIIFCPTVLGAISIKAAAYSVMGDRKRDRHLEDIAILTTVLTVAELRNISYSSTELRRLNNALAALSLRSSFVASLGAGDSIEMLKMALRR